jgi:ketosteroid isomerase-like protein
MEIDSAQRFVRFWEAAWNAHDLDRVLEHFHEDATFASRIAEHLLPGSSGVLVGKAAIREYWSKALTLIPTLRFTVERHFVGVGALVIQYRNQKDVVVNEVLLLEDGLVRHGYGTYLPEHEDPAGLSS